MFLALLATYLTDTVEAFSNHAGNLINGFEAAITPVMTNCEAAMCTAALDLSAAWLVLMLPPCDYGKGRLQVSHV